MAYRNILKETESALDPIQHDYWRMNNALPQELWDVPVLSISAINRRYINNGRFVGVIPAEISPTEPVSMGRVIIDAGNKQMLARRISFMRETYPGQNMIIIPMYRIL